uniref:RxLR effector candidate protein n=1 Tax=Hyaloperonospora arabidopsidis (strain Emoy2) TaxID=559515 RepID=M4BFZ7_HYAAE
MRDTIANLQSLYQRHGRVFSDGHSEPSDVSRRTGGRDPQLQSSAGCEALRCRDTADSRSSKRNDLFAAPSCHGGSRYASRESVDNRANPPMAVVGAEISTPYPLRWHAEVGRLQQRLHDLCDRAEQERQEHLSLEAWLQRIRLYRSDERSEFAFYQLENSGPKESLGGLERGGFICPRKRPRDDGTGGDDRHKT